MTEDQLKESSGLLFSKRYEITEMVECWYDEHPDVQLCTFNTVTALNQLGLLGGQKEIDQLRARVAELESGIKVVSIGLGFSLCYADGVVPRKDIKKQQNELDELLNRAHAQSLVKHDAAVLRTWAKNLRKIIVINAEDAADLTEQEADRLEQEAGL